MTNIKTKLDTILDTKSVVIINTNSIYPYEVYLLAKIDNNDNYHLQFDDAFDSSIDALSYITSKEEE